MASFSSQPSVMFPSIPFSIASTQQPLRLLELPPELAHIIEEQRTTAGKRRRLWFKSARARDEDGDVEMEMGKGMTTSKAGPGKEAVGEGEGERNGEGVLHLCDDDKMWAVRQVSTSNSVHVMKTVDVAVSGLDEMWSGGGASTESNGDSDGDQVMDAADDDSKMLGREVSIHGRATTSSTHGNPNTASKGITTISQMKSILELIGVPPPSETSVQAAVQAMVPVFADDETEGDRYSTSNPPGRVSLQQIYNDITAPENHVAAAMRRLLVFGNRTSAMKRELEGDALAQSPPHLFIPSTNLLLKCWVLFMTACRNIKVRLQAGPSPPAVSYQKVLVVLRWLCQGSFDPSEGDSVGNVILAVLRRVGTVVYNGEGQKEDEDLLGMREFWADSWLVGKGNDWDSIYNNDDDDDDDEQDDDDDDEAENHEAPTPGPRIILDPALTRQLVGQWLLLSLRQSYSPLSDLALDSDGTIAVTDFLYGWRHLLFKPLRRECDVRTLISGLGGGWEVCRDADGEEVLRQLAPELDADGDDDDNDSEAHAKGQSQSTKHGKWHEKFAAQRNATVKR